MRVLTNLNNAGNGDLDLYDIVFYPVYDGFIDPFFIRIAGQHQTLIMGKCKDFLIPQGEMVPASFVESPQVFSFWLYMQAAFLAKVGNFNEKLGVAVEISLKQAGDGEHGTVGGVMEAAKLVSGCFGGD